MYAYMKKFMIHRKILLRVLCHLLNPNQDKLIVNSLGFSLSWVRGYLLGCVRVITIHLFLRYQQENAFDIKVSKWGQLINFLSDTTYIETWKSYSNWLIFSFYNGRYIIIILLIRLTLKVCSIKQKSYNSFHIPPG